MGEIRDGVEIALSRKDGINDLLQQYYENYDRIAADDLEQSILDERYVENQNENILRQVRKIPDASICDLGCGQGRLSKRLLEMGATEVTCVDISFAYLSHLAQIPGLRPVLANAERLPFRACFDIVVSTDVMEHVLNVGSYLFCLNRALKQGGLAYIRVPYKENLLQYSPHLGCHYDFVHLRSFDEKILYAYFESAGFVVEKLGFDGFVLDTPQPFWTSSENRKLRYERFKEWAKGICTHPADVTTWPSIISKIFMKKQEIVVVVRKKENITQ